MESWKKSLPGVLAIIIVGLLWAGTGHAQGTTATKPGEVDENSSENVNLSDQDRVRSETYVNEALSNKVYNEECDKLNGACGGSGETEFAGMKGTQVKAIAKAYTTIMGVMSMAGVGSGGGSGGGDKSKIDYCALIPMGTEAVGMAMQEASSATLSAPTGGNTSQKDQVLRAARSHEDRAKTAEIQAAGFTGGTVCYVYKMTQPDWEWGVMNVIKVAATGLLAAFYWSEADQQKKYAKKLKDLANKLPGPGDCNPWTEKECYCGMEEYKHDPIHCAQDLHALKISNGALRVACLNDKVKADPQCQCIKTDSCMDKIYGAELGTPGFGFLGSPVGKDILSMTRGQLKNGQLRDSGTSNKALRDFLRKYGDKVPEVELTAAQKEEAKDLNSMGFPPRLSRLMASQPLTSKAKSNMSRFTGGPRPNYAKYKSNDKSNKNNVLTFSGGDGINKKKTVSSSGFNMNKFFPKKKSDASAKGGVLNFEEKAMKAAQISRDSDTNIFDIISRRYMVSGRRELGVE